MRYLKLTKDQRNLKRWRERRNHLVCKLLDEDSKLPRGEALRMANKMMREKTIGKGKKK